MFNVLKTASINEQGQQTLTQEKQQQNQKSSNKLVEFMFKVLSSASHNEQGQQKLIQEKQQQNQKSSNKLVEFMFNVLNTVPTKRETEIAQQETQNPSYVNRVPNVPYKLDIHRINNTNHKLNIVHTEGNRAYNPTPEKLAPPTLNFENNVDKSTIHNNSPLPNSHLDNSSLNTPNQREISVGNMMEALNNERSSDNESSDNDNVELS